MTDRGMKLACGSGSILEILELQPAGKKPMSGRDFANGSHVKLGQLLFL
jgi:methionyl-tRNA formyltransferase